MYEREEDPPPHKILRVGGLRPPLHLLILLYGCVSVYIIIMRVETRVYSTGPKETEEVGLDRGQAQNTSQWGWTLYEVMQR